MLLQVRLKKRLLYEFQFQFQCYHDNLCILYLSLNTDLIVFKNCYKTRKRFSEKLTVAFTIILNFHIYDYACMALCCGLEYLEFEDSSYNQLKGSPNHT